MVGTFLCGYGKGRYAYKCNGSFSPDCHHMYNVNTCDDFVFTTKMATVKEVLAEQRSINPKANIAYHHTFGVARKGNDAFGFKQMHQIFFIPAFVDDGQQTRAITQSTSAGKLPPNTIESSHSVVQTWAVEWSPQGLVPIRPLVLFKQPCDLPLGRALSLM